MFDAHELGVVGSLPLAVQGVSTVSAGSPVKLANSDVAACTSPAPQRVKPIVWPVP